jgi:hypothetical protein
VGKRPLGRPRHGQVNIKMALYTTGDLSSSAQLHRVRIGMRVYILAMSVASNGTPVSPLGWKNATQVLIESSLLSYMITFLSDVPL